MQSASIVAEAAAVHNFKLEAVAVLSLRLAHALVAIVLEIIHLDITVV